MIPVTILVPATTNVHHLNVIVGAMEIRRIQLSVALVPRELLSPREVYKMRLRFSAN